MTYSREWYMRNREKHGARVQARARRLRSEGRCTGCMEVSDYGYFCWSCTMKYSHLDEERTVKQAMLDAITAELAETDALIARLEGGERV